MRNSYSRVLALGGLAGLSISAPAMAQSTPSAPSPAESTTSTPGQSTAAPSLSIVDAGAAVLGSNHYNINASFSTGYESNVAGGSAAAAKARGLQQDDVIFT